MGRNVSVHGILNRYQLISYIVFYLSCDVINWVPLYTFFLCESKSEIDSMKWGYWFNDVNWLQQ